MPFVANRIVDALDVFGRFLKCENLNPRWVFFVEDIVVDRGRDIERDEDLRTRDVG